MRIIAGTLGGRVFASPKNHLTHPMSDRVRGGLFNVLGDIEGLAVLDAFAGSGALSFEAVSRGASSALALEPDTAAQRTIANNIASLQLQSQAKLVSVAAGAWLQTTDDTFDIVLLDPPYDDLQPNLLTKLAERAKSGGIVVISLPPKATMQLDQTYFELATAKNYGDAELHFYRRKSG